MSRWKQIVSGTDAAEIAEFAVVLPFVIMFLLAVILFGRAFMVYSTITYAAREGAQVAVQNRCATCPGPVPSNAEVANRVKAVLQAAHISPTGIAAYVPTPVPPATSSCGPMNLGTDSNVNIYSNALLNSASSGYADPAACGVIVSFQYQYQLSLLNPVPPFGNRTFTMNMKAVAPMLAEN